MIERNAIENILRHGIRAPSADNLQPWRFRINGDLVDFYLDRENIENFCDQYLLVPYLSAGAVLENMKVSALEAGLDFSATYFPAADDPLWFARLKFEKRPQAKANPHFRVLETRSTNRRFYSNRVIDEKVFLALNESIRQDTSFKIRWLKKEEPGYKNLSRVIGEADQIRFENQRLHRELMAVMRLDRKRLQETKDGLDIRSLESGPAGGLMFRLMSDWKRMKRLNRLGLSRLFNLYARKQMLSSHAAGLITAPDWSRESFIQGGEIMQKLWHEAALQGLALQPMEALPIFMIHLRKNSSADLSGSQQSRLQELDEEFRKIYGINREEGIIFLFRIGYASPPTAVSPRRPLESFILD